MEKENLLYEVFEEGSEQELRTHYYGHNVEHAMAVANALTPISHGEGVSMGRVCVVVYREVLRLTQNM